jgi:hypothetical protein
MSIQPMGKAAGMRKQRKNGFSRKSGASRKRKIVVAALVAGTAAVAAAPAQASNVAVCDFAVHIDLKGHGLTVSEILAGAKGDRRTTFDSTRPGKASCTGQVNGHTVRGDGSALISGTYAASPLCLRGIGTGSIEIRAPRFLAFFSQGYETLSGTFGLDLSGASWRQLGNLVDEAGQAASFSAISRMTPDSGSTCTVRAGILSGHLVVGGSYSDHGTKFKTERKRRIAA